MNKSYRGLFLILWCLFSLLLSCVAKAIITPEIGLLEISFPAPENEGHLEYLGVDGKGTFKIPQIDARLVLVEIFNMYCPHCQREAPKVNELYKKLQGSPRTKSEAKIIGIGVGNSAYEVALFKKAFEIPFPLFSDEDYKIHKRIGSVRTPYFLVFQNHKNKSTELIKAHLGPIGDHQKFLKEILDHSGL